MTHPRPLLGSVVSQIIHRCARGSWSRGPNADLVSGMGGRS